ncbi:hypothetical protein ANN_12949 [Periplaneta americana]|uniref:Uncharacterized protein n=1 Tax=Periplaneta americana TaxID=6978 RepID=A0ABQ8TK87_PERAM|nr:hypothetical protein ANN_12949 [Periplaneta americana]
MVGLDYSIGRQHSLKCTTRKRCRPVCTVVLQEEVESIPASSYEYTMVHCVFRGKWMSCEYLSWYSTRSSEIVNRGSGLQNECIPKASSLARAALVVIVCLCVLVIATLVVAPLMMHDDAAEGAVVMERDVQKGKETSLENRRGYQGLRMQVAIYV